MTIWQEILEHVRLTGLWTYTSNSEIVLAYTVIKRKFMVHYFRCKINSKQFCRRQLMSWRYHKYVEIWKLHYMVFVAGGDSETIAWWLQLLPSSDDPLSLHDSFNVADKIGRLYIQIDVNAKMILSQEHNLLSFHLDMRHASHSIVSRKE